MKFKEVRIPTKDLSRVYNYIRREAADHKIIGSNILCKDPEAELRKAASLRPDVPSAYLHWVLAFPQSDLDRLTPELVLKVWKRFFHLLEVPATCKYIIATHGADMQHSHALLCRVGTDASVYLGRFSVRKGIKATAQLEREFGLTITPTLTYHDKTSRRPILTKHEFEQKKRTGEPCRKERLVSIIEEAIANSGGEWLEFNRYCSTHGLHYTTIKRANGSMGITFTFEGVSYRGSKIGKAYSYLNLERTLSGIALDKLSREVPKHTVRDHNPIEIRASAEANVLAGDAPAEKRQEAEKEKRTLLERLDKLRFDCPKDMIFIVTLVYHIVGARLYNPRYYFMLRAQVKTLEEQCKALKLEEQRALFELTHRWDR